LERAEKKQFGLITKKEKKALSAPYSAFHACVLALRKDSIQLGT
jgi:hypothetical protein